MRQGSFVDLPRKEFDARVEAVDLWIDAQSNAERIAAAGLGARINAVHADAADLPFEDEAIDVIVSIDAFHYFGTEPGALERVTRVLRRGGRIGIVVPGVRHEIESWPSHLGEWWEDGFSTFHSPDWWREHWTRSPVVTVERADWVPNGSEHWLIWSQACDDFARTHGREPYEKEVAMLRADKDRLLGFSRVVATKK